MGRRLQSGGGDIGGILAQIDIGALLAERREVLTTLILLNGLVTLLLAITGYLAVRRMLAPVAMLTHDMSRACNPVPIPSDRLHDPRTEFGRLFQRFNALASTTMYSTTESSAAAFEHAPRYHGGGFGGSGLLPDEVPIIARRGELVVPPERIVREEKTAREQRPIRGAQHHRRRRELLSCEPGPDRGRHGACDRSGEPESLIRPSAFVRPKRPSEGNGSAQAVRFHPRKRGKASQRNGDHSLNRIGRLSWKGSIHAERAKSFMPFASA